MMNVQEPKKKKLPKEIKMRIAEGKYDDDFKELDLQSLCKKDGRKEKSSYRRVSILSNFSKESKKCQFEIYEFPANRFSKYQCGFLQGFQ